MPVLSAILVVLALVAGSLGFAEPSVTGIGLCLLLLILAGALMDDRLGGRSVVPIDWIEQSTSPLPRECSTTELYGLARHYPVETPRPASKAARKLPQGGGLRKLGRPPMVGPMTAQKPPQSSDNKLPQSGDREARLAEALRANLRRRKTQARERRETAQGEAPGIPRTRDLR